VGNKHLLEVRKATHVKARRARKVTERKMDSTHLLEAWEDIFKYDGKRGKRGEKARKGAERKVINMHLLKAHKARCKSDVKLMEKGIESDGKKAEKSARRREKGRKERWVISIY
jgi:hypothetical protein